MKSNTIFLLLVFLYSPYSAFWIAASRRHVYGFEYRYDFPLLTSAENKTVAAKNIQLLTKLICFVEPSFGATG